MARLLRDRLQQATTGHFGLDGRGIDYAGPSIGVVVAEQDDVDPDLLLSQADAAMYAAKRARKEAMRQH